MLATAAGVWLRLRLSSYGLVRRKLLGLLVTYRPLARAGLLFLFADCTLDHFWTRVRTAFMPSWLELYADDSFSTDNSRA